MDCPKSVLSLQKIIFDLPKVPSDLQWNHCSPLSFLEGSDEKSRMERRESVVAALGRGRNYLITTGVSIIGIQGRFSARVQVAQVAARCRRRGRFVP